MSMDESEAVSFFDEMVNDTPSTARETYVLESETGHELTVYIKQLDRAYVIDKLAELPDEMLQQMEDVDDPENMDEEDAIEATNGLGGLSGDAIRAFEELCAEGMDHSDLTTLQAWVSREEEKWGGDDTGGAPSQSTRMPPDTPTMSPHSGPGPPMKGNTRRL